MRRILTAAQRIALDSAADLRHAVRLLRWHPGFTTVAVVSLAIGIGFNTAVFSIINTIFFQQLRGVAEADRVVYVGTRETYAAYREVREGATSLASAAAWQPVQVDIRYGDLTVRKVVPAVSSNYFDVLGVRPYAGRFFGPAATEPPSADPVVVLEYEFWRQSLGSDQSAIGRTLTINGVPAVIVGVAPREFHGVERPPLWMPMGMLPTVQRRAPRWQDPSENGWRIVGRLQTDARLETLGAELQLLAARSPEAFPAGALQASNGRERWTGPVSREKQIEFLLVVVMPLVIVGLVLWIGCSNVANLLLARAAARRKEIAIRLATGATRGRLIRLLMTESLVLAAIGGACGVLIAWWTLDLAWATLPEFSALAVDIDGRVLGYTAAVSIASTLLFGTIPALHSTRPDVAPQLKGDGPREGTVRGTTTRRFFLVTQFAASMAVLLVAGTFVRAVIDSHVGPQARYLDHLALAYVEMPRDPGAPPAVFWTGVRDTLLQQPGVASVSRLDRREEEARAIGGNGTVDRRQPALTVQRIDPHYFETLGIAVVAGRDLAASTAPGAGIEEVIVNERAAAQLGQGGAVLGRDYPLDAIGSVRIVGVVRDLEDRLRIYRRSGGDDSTDANLLIKTSGASAQALPAVRAALAGPSNQRGFVRVSTLRDAMLGGVERLTRLALAVAGIVLLLAAVGLYGSIAFVTAQRTREIAIRAALGAPRAAVLGLVAREGGRVVAAGSILGVVMCGIAFRFMDGMLFPAWTLSPALLAGVALVFGFVSIAACYIPVRRALAIQPMSVLKSE